MPQHVEADTMDASPHVLDLLARWHPDSLRLFCVTSFASWPNYVYVRHVAPATPARQPCAEPDAPLVIQTRECPQGLAAPRFPAPWVVIQCGPTRYRRYIRVSPGPKSPATLPRVA